MTASVWNPNPGLIPVVNPAGLFKSEVIRVDTTKRVINLSDFAYTPNTESLLVFKNGQVLNRNDDFVEVDATSFILAEPVDTNDTIYACAFTGILGTAIVDNVLRSDLGAKTGAARVGYNPNFVGSKFRTLEDKARDVVNVNDFVGGLKEALQKVNPYTDIIIPQGYHNIVGLFSNDFNFGAGPAGGFVANTKKGIRLIGQGMPKLSSNGRYLEGGTVILGTLFNLAEGFEVYNLGIDCGADVVTNLYGGQYAEVFVPGANTSFPIPQATIKNINVDRVIALGAVPDVNNNATYKHVMLFENLENVRIGHIEAIGGWHAFVSKSVVLKASSIVVRGGMGDCVNFNANAANRCQQNQISMMHIDSWVQDGVEQKAGTFTFFSDASLPPYISKVKIGTLLLRNMQNVDGITISGNAFVTDVSIDHLDADMGNTTAAAAIHIGYNPTKVQRFIIGTHNVITSGRAFDLGPNAEDVHFGDGVQTYIGDAKGPVILLDGPRYTHGAMRMVVNFPQTGPYLIQRNAGDVDINRVTLAGSANPGLKKLLSSTPGAFTKSANCVDAAIAGFAAAGLAYLPYRVQMAGAVKLTTAGTAVSLGSVSPGPNVQMRFPVHVQTANAQLVTRTLEITANGNIYVIDACVVNDIIFLDSVNYSCLTR